MSDTSSWPAAVDTVPRPMAGQPLAAPSDSRVARLLGSCIEAIEADIGPVGTTDPDTLRYLIEHGVAGPGSPFSEVQTGSFDAIPGTVWQADPADDEEVATPTFTTNGQQVAIVNLSATNVLGLGGGVTPPFLPPQSAITFGYNGSASVAVSSFGGAQAMGPNFVNANSDYAANPGDFVNIGATVTVTLPDVTTARQPIVVFNGQGTDCTIAVTSMQDIVQLTTSGTSGMTLSGNTGATYWPRSSTPAWFCVPFGS